MQAGNPLKQTPAHRPTIQFPSKGKDLMLLAFITLTVIIAAFLVYGIFILAMEAAISEGFGK